MESRSWTTGFLADVSRGRYGLGYVMMGHNAGDWDIMRLAYWTAKGSPEGGIISVTIIDRNYCAGTELDWARRYARLLPMRRALEAVGRCMLSCGLGVFACGPRSEAVASRVHWVAAF